MSLAAMGLARCAAQGAFVALLMTGAATGALAAPSARDAKLDAMQQQLDAMRVQIEALKTSDAADQRVSAMQQQLDAFAQQLAELKTAQDSAAADIITLKSPPVATTLPNGKPAFASSDKRFTANIRAIIMLDGGKYFQKDNLPAAVSVRDLNQGLNFRRARIGFDGKVFSDFDYSLVYEFGGSGAEDPGRLYEASITYTALKPWRIKVGAFEPNIGLAAVTSTSQMPLMERPSPAEVARNVGGGDSRLALQISANGDFGEGDVGIGARWLFSTAFTGNTIGTISSAGAGTAQPFDEQTAWIARVALAPYSGTDWQAHFGASFQAVMQPNDAGQAATPRYPIQLRDRPELRLDGARLVDTGAIDAKGATVFGAEAAVGVRNVLLEGEYFRYEIDRRLTGAATPSDPHFSGWYVQGSWVLTGESRPYNPVEGRFEAPKQNFNFNPSAGTWGAFELAARYSSLNLNHHDCGAGRAIPASPAACFDAVRGGEQKISTIGLNWYLNPALRMMFDVQHVDIDRFNAAGVQIGQTYNALAMRGQFTF